MSEKTARRRISGRQCELWNQLTELLFEHMPSEDAWEAAGLVWRIEDLVQYKASTSDEQMDKDLLFEVEYLPICPNVFTNEQIEAGEGMKPLEELCPHEECPERPQCWAAQNTEPPTLSDVGDFFND